MIKKLTLLACCTVLILMGCTKNIAQSPAQEPETQQTTASVSILPLNQTQAAPQAQADPGVLNQPISNALSRITKKPFGLKVSPGHSPVSPEKFSGYHTGTDFETTPEEQNTDVAIFAACNGKLLMKKIATGYGGVAVQSCKLNGQDVTLVYGHLKFLSIIPAVGDALTAGEQIAVLGKGYSKETDGERKHLHFGIHKGTAISILGYVQSPALLKNWLDAQKYL